MGGFIVLILLGTTVWVGIDASNLGVRRGRLAGSALDMSVGAWVVCCLLLWIVAFPCYLVARGRYVALQAAPVNGYSWPALGPHGYVAPQPYSAVPPYGAPQPHVATYTPVAQTYQSGAPAAAPPQLSHDGHWWWDGQQWTPVVPPARS